MKIHYALLTFVVILLFFRYHPESVHFERIKNADSLSLYSSDVDETEYWKPQLDEYSPQDIAAAKQILKNDFHLLDQDASFQKMMKIATGLIRVMRERPGNPGPDVFRLTPIELYHRCKQGNIDVYCTQYTLLFTYFCKMAQLTVRPIESFGANDRHSTYECFLPEEHRWVWCDLLNNIIYLEDEKGKLNLLQTLHYLRCNRMLDVNVIGLNDSFNRQIRLGKAIEKTLQFNFDSTCVFHFYHETNLAGVYSRRERFLRFLGDKTWYERVALKPLPNTWYYLKYLFFLAFIVSGILICRSIFVLFSKRKNNFIKNQK